MLNSDFRLSHTVLGLMFSFYTSDENARCYWRLLEKSSILRCDLRIPFIVYQMCFSQIPQQLQLFKRETKRGRERLL